MDVVINFILHCYRCDTNKMCTGFPCCLRASLAYAATTMVGVFTLYAQNLHLSGRPPQTTCARWDRTVNALQLCQWKFSHKETLLQTFLERNWLLYENRPFCIFELPFGALEATYDVYLRLIRKRIVNVLLVIIDFFRWVLWLTHYKRI